MVDFWHPSITIKRADSHHQPDDAASRPCGPAACAAGPDRLIPSARMGAGATNIPQDLF
ncbi:MAG TPA: hypothetical protein VL461_15770 [Dictyobacter sp.]|nr:hypothetical protein [Dictyobacter sp.]